MRKVRVAALAALTSLALFPSMAEASSTCWYPNEARAAQLRGLQTMLMVGTLQCRNTNRYSVDLYDDFITNQRSFLDANSYVLKGHFMREGGIGEGQRAYDAFATSLANRYSAQMDRPEYCETVDEFVRLAGRASKQELLRLAEAVAEAPDSGACAPSEYRFETADAEMGRPDYDRTPSPPPPPRIAVVEPVPAVAPAVADQPAPVQVADGKEAVIEKVVTAAAPVTPPAPIPAAAVQPNKEEALKTAIVALQSAITALQAATSAEVIPASAEPPLVNVPDSPVVPPQEPGKN